MVKPASIIDVQFASTTANTPGEDKIRRWIESALDAAGGQAAFEVSVRVVDEDEMQSLNRTFRERDRPTNVLSFPAGETSGLPASEARPLGDIVLCASVIDEEAEEQQKAPSAHWAHMLVHGTLHLLGYDHESEAEARQMESLEADVLARQGFPDPYTGSL